MSKRSSLCTLLVFIVFALNSYTAALRCYACGGTENDPDQTCFEHPEEVKNGIITCTKKFCTTIRQEYLDPKDKVASLARTCEDEPLHKNEIIEDSTYRFYFIACQDDLCNGGSGKDTSNNNGAQGDTGGVGTLLVPGIGKNSVANSLPSIATITLLLLTALYYSAQH